MSCHEVRGLLDGYVDSERDVPTTLNSTGHLKAPAVDHFSNIINRLTSAVQVNLPCFGVIRGSSCQS